MGIYVKAEAMETNIEWDQCLQLFLSKAEKYCCGRTPASFHDLDATCNVISHEECEEANFSIKPKEEVKFHCLQQSVW